MILLIASSTIIFYLSSRSVESAFVVAPFPGAYIRHLALAPSSKSKYLNLRRRQHHVIVDGSTSSSDDEQANNSKDELPIMSVDDNRRKLILGAPSVLSILLTGNDSASASTVTADDITLDTADSSVEMIENNANRAMLLEKSTPQQVNTAISTTQQSSSSRGGTLCADSEETSRIAIFERVAPSVVYIDTFSEKRDVFSTNVLEVPVGSGSGFIWDTNGHIVTNFHVIQEAKSAQVAILTSGNGGGSVIKPAYTSVRPGALGLDGSTVLPNYTRIVYKAKVIGVDPTKDIAVLKVDDAPIRELRPIEVGTSTGLRVGQGSLAIGNPFGLDHTLT
jgi:hypothetical protein